MPCMYSWWPAHRQYSVLKIKDIINKKRLSADWERIDCQAPIRLHLLNWYWRLGRGHLLMAHIIKISVSFVCSPRFRLRRSTNAQYDAASSLLNILFYILKSRHLTAYHKWQRDYKYHCSPYYITWKGNSSSYYIEI